MLICTALLSQTKQQSPYSWHLAQVEIVFGIMCEVSILYGNHNRINLSGPATQNRAKTNVSIYILMMYHTDLEKKSLAPCKQLQHQNFLKYFIVSEN